MNLLGKLRAYAGVLRRAKRRPALGRLLRRRLPILAAVTAYETALLAANRVDVRLKTLGAIKTSALIGCPF